MVRIVTLALLSALSLALAEADPAAADSWGVEFDNDKLMNTDRHFTHGTRLFWMSEPDETPDWAGNWADALPRIDGPGSLQIGASLGQNMFTPGDTSTTDIVQNDRPYAGWLYGGVALARTHEGNRRAWELDIGIVGPASMARQTQILVHRTIDVSIPRGWANQLRNEPGIVLLYEEMWQHMLPFDVGGAKFALTPHIAGSLGNIYTYAAAGGALRFGEFSENDFGPTRIHPGVPGSDAVRGGDGFDWYLFAGADGRFVARNIFLDGNTFTDSHSVDKRPFVLDLQVGVTLAFDNVQLSFMQVFRTREFRRQTEADRFGVARAAVRF